MRSLVGAVQTGRYRFLSPSRATRHPHLEILTATNTERPCDTSRMQSDIAKIHRGIWGFMCYISVSQQTLYIGVKCHPNILAHDDAT